MKKLLLCVLASVGLPCLGTPVRINLVARGDVRVPLVGDYYDEQAVKI